MKITSRGLLENTWNGLDVHFGAFHDDDKPGASGEYLEWIGLLKSCTAFEAYCKIYTADFQPKLIADFLLLNQRFPHSVCFSIEQVQKGLQGIAEATEGRMVGQVYRLVGRLRATLDFAQIDEIMAMDMHTYLVDIQNQCYQIHNALYQQYIAYPIEAALAEES
jgi:uncharacterized alpha-E superfamily protein